MFSNVEHDYNETFIDAQISLEQEFMQDPEYSSMFNMILDNGSELFRNRYSMMNETLPNISSNDSNIGTDNVRSFVNEMFKCELQRMNSCDYTTSDNELEETIKFNNDFYNFIFETNKSKETTAKLLSNTKIKIEGKDVANYKMKTRKNSNNGNKTNRTQMYAKTSNRRRKEKKNNLNVQSVDEVRENSEIHANIPTMFEEPPVLEAADKDSLLDIFETMSSSMNIPMINEVSMKSNETAQIQPSEKTLTVIPESTNSPIFPEKQNSPVLLADKTSSTYAKNQDGMEGWNIQRNQPSTSTSTLTSKIQKIKDSNKKIRREIPVIPAMPNINKARRNGGKRKLISDATSSKTKSIDVKNSVNNKIVLVNSESIMLDHDYCSSLDCVIDKSNNSDNKKNTSDKLVSANFKTLSERNIFEKMDHPSAKKVTSGTQQTKSRAKSEKINIKKCQKDNASESTKNNDNNKKPLLSISNNIYRTKKQINKQTKKLSDNIKSQKQNIKSSKNVLPPNETGNSSYELKLNSALVTRVWKSKCNHIPKLIQSNTKMVSVLKTSATSQPTVQTIATNSDNIVKTIHNDISQTRKDTITSILKTLTELEPIVINNSNNIEVYQETSEKVEENKSSRKKINLDEYKRRKGNIHPPMKSTDYYIIEHCSTTTKPTKDKHGNLSWCEREFNQSRLPRVGKNEAKPKASRTIQTIESDIGIIPDELLVEVIEENGEKQSKKHKLEPKEEVLGEKHTVDSHSCQPESQSNNKSINKDQKDKKRNSIKSPNEYQDNRKTKNRSQRSNEDRYRRTRSRSRSSNEDRYRRSRSRSRSSSTDRYRSTRSSSTSSNENRYRRMRNRTTRPNEHQNQRNTNTYGKMTQRNSRSYQEQRPPIIYRNPNFNKEDIPQEREYIVYVGLLEENVTINTLIRRFKGFGTIMQASLHFPSDTLMSKYSFITYSQKDEATRAIEHANDNRNLPQYILSFGNRREFCNARYKDLVNKYDWRWVILHDIVEDNVTINTLIRRFKDFGTIMQASLHFPSDILMNKYSFITYSQKDKATRAIEHAKGTKNLPRYLLNFGNRREFWNARYLLNFGYRREFWNARYKKDLDENEPSTMRENNQDKVQKKRIEMNLLRMSRDKSFDNLLKKAKAERRLV